MMLNLPTRSARGAATGLAAIAFLCACGGSSSSTGSHAPAAGGSTASSAAQQTTTPSAAGATKAAGAHAIDVCAIITAAKASQLSGHQITTAGPGTGLQSKEYGCAYSNDDGTVQIQVTVFEHDAKKSYDLFSSQSKNVTQVSGLGDKAFYDNDETMYVLAGDNLIQVNGADSADHCAALARPVLSAL
jgi:hypothetical protein